MRSSTLDFTDRHACSVLHSISKPFPCIILEGLVAHVPGNKFPDFVLAWTEGEHRKLSPPEDV